MASVASQDEGLKWQVGVWDRMSLTYLRASALTGVDPVLLMETDPASAHEFVISTRDQPIFGLG